MKFNVLDSILFAVLFALSDPALARTVSSATTLSLDTRTGVRRAAEVETLQYDTAWYGGAVVTATVDDGSAVFHDIDGNEPGEWYWTTSGSAAGKRTLSLLADGKVVETAQFAVNASYLDIAPEGDGTVNVESGWFAQTATAIVRATAAEHWSFARWDGDTSGCRISGATIRAPMTTDRSIRAVFERNQRHLTVEWAHGDSAPTNGVHSVGEGLEVSASVPEVVFLAEGVKAECLGWAGTGSAPAAGTGTNVTFTVLADSSISWIWQTNYLMRVTVEGDGAVDVSEEWVPAGQTLAVTATPGSTALASAQWSGDVDGATVDGYRISLPGDRPRDVKITFRALDLGLVLEQENRTWTTSGDVAWSPVLYGAHDGVDAARCETPEAGYSENFLSATFSGPGDLSFWWKAESEAENFCGVDLLVDGELVTWLEDMDAWQQETVSLEAGPHTVEWLAWSDGASVLWLDEVSFSGAEATATSTTPEPVPHSWLADSAASILAAHGGDYEAAALATAANGRPVWECYVADLDPTDPDDDLKVAIAMKPDGAPEVTILSGESAERVYETQGAPSPGGPWGEVTDDSRFFRVKVSLPE